jgi:hypothetical protein
VRIKIVCLLLKKKLSTLSIRLRWVGYAEKYQCARKRRLANVLGSPFIQPEIFAKSDREFDFNAITSGNIRHGRSRVKWCG